MERECNGKQNYFFLEPALIKKIVDLYFRRPLKKFRGEGSLGDRQKFLIKSVFACGTVFQQRNSIYTIGERGQVFFFL